ncbi:MAG: phosphodiesterase [Candidatus Obscuribacterales bacterium]|nr:phosphodiesterase [Candidatus Obscuribacterales bacterium]
MTDKLKFVQFTDTHLYENSTHRMRGVDTGLTFQQVVQQVAALHPEIDFALLTGDISMDETAESYDRVREIVATINAPKYFLPGNHDCFETMKQSFSNDTEKSNIRSERSFSNGNWFIILLDSTVTGRIEGNLRDRELKRLDSELSQNSDKHALVCLHHNPLPFSTEPEHDYGLKNPEALFAVLDKHSNVKGVVWGHVHSEHNLERKGVPFLASPSTCIQFKLEDDGVSVDNKAPGYRVFELNQDGSIDSTVEWLPHLPEGLQLVRL